MASEIKVDTIVNAGGDNDSGIDLGTNDAVKVTIAGSEKARVDSNGHLLVGKTSTGIGTVGAELKSSGELLATVSGDACAFLNRTSSDGNVMELRKDGTTILELGSIGGSNGYVEGHGDRAGVSYGGADMTPRKNGADSDDGVNLGHPSVRWDVVYAGSASINTSDQNDKQDIEALTDTEMKVAKRISVLFKKFKFKNSVSKSGSNARTHIGVIAQEVESAFTAEGLDASKYAFWCKDTWWEKEITFDSIKSYKDIKKEETDGYTKRVRHGIRYAELLAFLSAYNEQRFASIEARLTALESK